MTLVSLGMDHDTVIKRLTDTKPYFQSPDENLPHPAVLREKAKCSFLSYFPPTSQTYTTSMTGEVGRAAPCPGRPGAPRGPSKDERAVERSERRSAAQLLCCSTEDSLQGHGTRLSRCLSPFFFSDKV